MAFKKLKPRKALNKAYLKVKPNRSDIELFKTQLITLLDRTNDKESEEFHKNLVSDFLKDTYYKQNHFINTKGRNDLVIHNGQNANSTVGVIIEAKKPTNKAEMLSTEKLNVKAFQELVLYYLRERVTQKNLEVKHLIATNLNEWFIFDANLFDRLFAQNKTLVKLFTDFEEGRLAETKTDFFYKQIAEPHIESITAEIEFTYFNLQDFQKPLRNANKADDNALIALFKLLSPEHLLKLPFTNDSNSLDKRFYSELLHIIGLTETKEGGKKLIGRNKEGDRHTGTLLEDAIIQLDSLDKINRLDKPSQFGGTRQEQLFNVALELSITWINRILFLKLLEAQLISYQRGNKSYAFLHLGKIKNYDDLNSLFFQVLARKFADRNEDVKDIFEKVPYLNSSLFEPTELEQVTLFISNLRDEKTIPVFSQTVLKDPQGKKRTGNLSTLQYLLEFLDAYDFGAEGGEEIQEDNKTLINASVLGLIFEKINGYKDGSFFTPGFITMYMCRETIRRAVVQKFNEIKKWNCTSLDEIYDKIEDRLEANQIVNSLKICDPAVGSGHFLVSALNEMIAVKNDLKILQDREGKRLKEYQVEVVNDELTVTDEEGELFEYHPGNKESQRIQETLFHEKQTIIENCLFGVDINPNSVKICRLRLWIELLKNAYYKSSTELETLPNIDINIKCGNSLVSRFALDADLSIALKSVKWNVKTYRGLIHDYQNATDKEAKRGFENLINDIKKDFRSEIHKNDPLRKKLNELNGQLFIHMNQTQIFALSAREKSDFDLRTRFLESEIAKKQKQIEEIESNKIYEDAFEWRFEFPEVLNDEGDFVGFDVVIGNPPYIRQEEISWMKPYLQSNFTTYTGTADLYVFFVEKGMNLLKADGHFVYILPNKWMKGGYGKELRKWAAKKETPLMVDFGDLPVFEEATTYPTIWMMQNKSVDQAGFKAALVDTLSYAEGLDNYLQSRWIEVNAGSLNEESWNLVDNRIQQLLDKIKAAGKPLGEFVNGKIYRGLLTGLNEAFVIDLETKERLIAEDPKSAELIKPFLAGRDIKRYAVPVVDKWIILIPKGFTIKSNLNSNRDYFVAHEPTPRYGSMEYDPAWEWFRSNYPAIARHLKPFERQAKARLDQGDFWWELRACDYYREFEKPKIILPSIVKGASYTFDDHFLFSNDKTSIICTQDVFLLGLINSKVVDFFLKQIAATRQNGYFEYKPVYVSQLPIVSIDDSKKFEIEILVQKILEKRNQDSQASIDSYEKEIDHLVYQLYGLTEEEITIVEGHAVPTDFNHS